MENCLATQGIRQKYNGGLQASFTTTGRFIDAPFLVFGYDAWTWKKQSKQWRKLIKVCVEHTNQGLGYMIALKGWATTGPL